MKIKTAFWVCLFLIFSQSFASACTDFQVKAKDGTIIIARSMELGIDLNSQICVFPRGQKNQSMISASQKGIEWTSKYGYLAIDGLNKREFISDGMNEEGLSVELLNFFGSIYQNYEPGKSLSLTDLTSWILGNFATTSEVKEALKKVNVVRPDVSGMPITGAHFAVHDANGDNIVIEYIEGKLKIYDNPLGVMTNRPQLDWHLTNLKNYINLDINDNDPKTLGPIKIESLGSGNSWLGLPGDWTPPSRFVRVAFAAGRAPQPQDASQALILANHILSIVDIPHGLFFVKEENGQILSEYTQWVVLKDLTSKILYYRSYSDAALRMIDLKKLNFTPQAQMRSIPIENPATLVDVTDKLK